MRVKLALRNALESEAEFVEAEDADAQLLALLRKPPARASSSTKQGQDKQDQTQPSTPPKNRKPGKRSPGRDSTGAKSDEEAEREPTNEERAAG